jgi:low affinity Fe/Cu permease
MFSRLSCTVSSWAGKPVTFFIALVALIIAWLIWDIEKVNFGISVVSLLLLFLIQGSQNQGDAATHAKLDEMIRASDARNDFIGLDRKPEDEVKRAREA